MKNSEQIIEIPLNKTKIVMMLIGTLIFVVIGFWLGEIKVEIREINATPGECKRLLFVFFTSGKFF